MGAEENKSCPCDTVKELRKQVIENTKETSDIKTAAAVTDEKLKAIILTTEATREDVSLLRKEMKEERERVEEEKKKELNNKVTDLKSTYHSFIKFLRDIAVPVITTLLIGYIAIKR